MGFSLSGEPVPVIMREVAEQMRPITKEGDRTGGTANKTNAKVNNTVKALGKVGKVSGAAAGGIAVYNIVTAEDKPRAIAKETGVLTGAIIGGELGAKGGAGIGAFFGGAGALPGAIAGGVIGSVAGGIAGGETVEYLYDKVTNFLNNLFDKNN